MNMLKSVPIAAHDKSVTTQAQSTNKTEFYHANLINNKQHYKTVIDVRLTNSLNSKKCCFHGFAKQCNNTQFFLNAQQMQIKGQKKSQIPSKTPLPAPQKSA